MTSVAKSKRGCERAPRPGASALSISLSWVILVLASCAGDSSSSGDGGPPGDASTAPDASAMDGSSPVDGSLPLDGSIGMDASTIGDGGAPPFGAVIAVGVRVEGDELGGFAVSEATLRLFEARAINDRGILESPFVRPSEALDIAMQSEPLTIEGAPPATYGELVLTPVDGILSEPALRLVFTLAGVDVTITVPTFFSVSPRCESGIFLSVDQLMVMYVTLRVGAIVDALSAAALWPPALSIDSLTIDPVSDPLRFAVVLEAIETDAFAVSCVY